MPSQKTGEMGCAFIIPRAGQTIDLQEVVRFLDEAGLARQKFPEHLVLVDDLPRVPSGKVRKDVLRAQAKEIAGVLILPGTGRGTSEAGGGAQAPIQSLSI